jgi:hypothetical protein
MKAILKDLQGFETTRDVPEPPPPELRLPVYEPVPYDMYSKTEIPKGSYRERYFILEYVKPPYEVGSEFGGGTMSASAIYQERDMKVKSSPPAKQELYLDAVAQVLHSNPDLEKHQSRIIKLSESFPMDHKNDETPQQYLERLVGIAKTDQVMLEEDNKKWKKETAAIAKKLAEEEAIAAQWKKQQAAYEKKTAELEEAKKLQEEAFEKAKQLLMPKFIPYDEGFTPEAAPPKEVPPVEAPKKRLIRLKKKG